jgi:ubiquitin conjugation factor E4 B
MRQLRATQMLEGIFRVTTNPACDDKSLRYVPDAGDLSPSTMDEVLYNVLTTTKTNQSLFEYLSECVSRAYDESRKLASSKNEELRNLTEEALSLATNYACTILLNPSEFPHPVPADPARQLLSLLEQMGTKPGLDRLFDLLIAETEKANKIPDVFYPVVKLLVERSQQSTSLEGDYNQALGPLYTLSNKKVIGAAIINIPGFLPVPPAVATGKQYELFHIFGSFLRVWLDPVSQSQHFGEPSKKSQQQVNLSYKKLRENHDSYVKALSSIFTNLLKAGEPTKEKLLQYFASVLKANNGRDKQNMDNSVVSGDGFAINFEFLLTELACPIFSSKKPYSMVDYKYIRSRNGSVFPLDATTILPCEDFLRSLVPVPEDSFKFVTRVFFAALRAHTLGMGRDINGYKMLLRQISYMHRNPDPRAKMQFELLLSRKLAQDLYLCDKVRVASTTKLMSAGTLFQEWTVKLVCRNMCIHAPSIISSTNA